MNTRAAAESIHIVILDDNLQGSVPAIEEGLRRALPRSTTRHFEAVADFLAGPAAFLDPDVVLLDVMDMDKRPEDAIPAIHRHWPRLPILLLTRVEEIRDALEFFRLGARGYILKSDLGIPDTIQTYSLTPKWKDKQWSKAADT